MANKMSIGAGLALDGEKQFKQAITDINKTMAVLASEAAKVTAQYGANANSLEALNAKSDTYNKQIAEQKAKIEQLKAALQNSADNFGENDKRTKDWQISLNKAEAQLATTERELKQTTDQIDRFGDEAKQSGTQVEKAGNQAEKSGWDAKDGGEKWAAASAAIARAGQIAAAAAAALGAAAIAAGAALIKTTVDAAAYSDEILTLNAQTGISTQKLQEYKYAAELIDVPLDTITGSMAKLTKNMATAQKGTGDAANAFKALGVDITNQDGSLKSNQEVFAATIDALGKMENETQRDALAMQIFGKSAQDLNPLIKAGGDALEKFGTQAQAAGAVLTGEQLAKFGAFDDAIQGLTGGANAAKNALGTILLPMLTQMAGEGTALLGEFTNGLLAANGDVSKMGDVISTVLPKAVDVILKGLPQMMETGFTIISALGQGILNNLPAIIDAAVKIIPEIINGLISALPALGQGAIQIIMALATALIDNLPAIVDAGVGLIVSLMQGLSEALPELIPAAENAILTICEALIDNLDLLIDAAIELTLAIADGVIAGLPIILDKAPVIIDKLVQALIDNLPKLLDLAGKLIGAFVKGIVDNFPKIIAETVPALGKTLYDAFAQIFAPLKKINDQSTQNFKDNISKIATYYSELPSKISGAFKNVISSISKWGTDVSNWFNTEIPKIIDGVVKFFNDLPGKIGFAIGFIAGTLEKWRTDVVNWFTTEVPKIIENVVTFFKELPEKIGTAISGAVTSVSEWVAGMIETAQTEVPKIIEGVLSFFKTIPARISLAIGEARNQLIIWAADMKKTAETEVPKIITTIMEFFSSLPSKVFAVGESVVKNLWNGINSLYGWIYEKLKEFIDNLTAGYGDGKDGGTSKTGGTGNSTADEAARIAAEYATASSNNIATLSNRAFAGAPATQSRNYTFAPGSVVIDAKNVKDFNDVVRAVTGFETSMMKGYA